MASIPLVKVPPEEEVCEYRDCTEDYERVASFFASHEDELSGASRLAAAAADLTEEAGIFVQAHTSVVCPACEKVCCANRHSYHEFADMVYLRALGERPPVYRKGIADDAPCQFIGERGCTISRSLRPYRCNWYFCTPLLEHMQSTAARDYRRFTALMTEAGRNRERLLELYNAVRASRMGQVR